MDTDSLASGAVGTITRRVDPEAVSDGQGGPPLRDEVSSSLPLPCGEEAMSHQNAVGLAMHTPGTMTRMTPLPERIAFIPDPQP